jgi:protein gp37
MNRTKIDWCHYTWNPIVGCSFGCPWCYARRFAERGLGEYGQHPKGERFKPRFLPDRYADPCGVQKPSRVFVCSMGDMFGPEVQPDWIDDTLSGMTAADQHRFLVLTKRPQRIEQAIYEGEDRYLGGAAMPNLWLGTSVTNQDDAMVRIPALLETTRHGGRFVSVEPMLGPVDLRHWLGAGRLDWVVVGAQTGPGAERLDIRLVANLARQCCEAGVPLFVKGNVPIVETRTPQQAEMHRIPWPREYPEGLRVREED